MPSYISRLAFIVLSVLVPLFQPLCWAQSAPTYGNILVDRLGATNYSLPINAPEGVGGVNPNIGVTYNSQGKNGLLGKGGGIKGLSFISRCQQTLARDGVSKAISWSGEDRFCVDGQRLILTAGTQGASGSQYHTEIDNGVVYTAISSISNDPDFFQAQAKDGSILVYGGVSSAKDIGGATRTWALTSFKSREGNSIEYIYEGASDSGLRIKKINYAFPIPDTTSGANAYLEFEYKDRDDPLSQYVAGYEFRTTKTLSKINSYGAAGVLYRSYIFDIVASTALAGETSRWQSVKECISLTNCFNPISFSWGRTTQNASNVTEPKGITVDFLGTMARNFTPTKTPQLSAKNCSWCVAKAADLNGNGIAEFIWMDEVETGTYRAAVSFDGAVLPYESVKKAQPVSTSSYDSSVVQSIPSPEFGDLNADGFVDVLTPLRPIITGTYSTSSWWLGMVARSVSYWRVSGEGSLNSMEFVKALDLDSDGFQEFVSFKSKSLDLNVSRIKKKQVTNDSQYYLDDNTNSTVSYHLSDYPARLPLKSMVQIAPSSAAVGDFDADGNEDLLLYMLEADTGTKQQTQKIKWYSKVGTELLYRGTVAQWTQNSLSLASSAPDSNGDIIVDFVGLSKITPIDINGDGLVDVAFKQFSSKSWMYAINTGNGFLPLETLVLPSRAANADSDTFVDVNNDGYADFIYSGTVSGSSTLNIFVKYWNAKLKKFSDPVSIRQTTRNPVLYADMNGDGYADFVEFSSADNSINVYGFTNNAGSTAGGYQGVIAQDTITSIKEGSSSTTDIEYQTLIKPGKIKEQTCKIGSGNTTVPCQDLQSTSQYTPLQIKITHPTVGTLEGDSMDSAEYYAKTNDPFSAYNNPLVGSARVFQYVAPLPIVTHVSTATTNIISDKKYFYSVMRAQSGGRGLLGFEKTWVEDQLTGLKTETQWRQDWPFTGMESVKLLWNKYGVAISEDENTLVVPASNFSGVLSPSINKTIHKQYNTSLTDTKQGALIGASESGNYYSSASSSLSSSSSSSVADVSALQLILPEEGNITKVGLGVAQGMSVALTTSDGQVLKDINGTVPRVKYYVDNYVFIAEGNADGTPTTWTPDVPGTYSVQAKAVLPNGKELSSRVAGLVVAGQSGYPSIAFTNSLRNGNTYLTNATVNIYANAVDADGTIASVTFYANNTAIATKTAPTVVGGTQYRYDWVPTVAGTYKIKAVAKDNSNNTSTTKTIEIFVGIVPSSSSSSVSSQAYPALTIPVPSSEQKIIFGDMTSLSTQIIGSDLKQWSEVDQTIPDAKFFANNQYLGKSKASGLGLNWTPSMGGVYEVVAASLLQSGNQVVSPRGAIIVKNDSAPFVNLSAPKYEGTSYRLNDLVLVSATAEAAVAATPISKLTFYANDVEIYTDTSAPYSLAWAPPAVGTYNIKAVAVDAAGNVGVSAIRRIQYGISSMSGSSSSANYFTSSSVSSSSSSVATNATIELSYPRVNKYENFGLGAEVILVSYVWASGNIEWHDANGQLAQVDYYANGQLLTGLRADERGHLKYWTPPAAGLYAIKAVAHVDNNKTIESGIGNFFIRSANAPIITVNTPAKNTTIKIGDSLQLDATVTDPDNDLAMVRFYVNDQELLLNPLVKPPFTTTWTPPIIGTYSVKVEAMDDSGVKAVSSPATVSVVLPGFSPTASIVAPTNGSSVSFASQINISAVANDLDGTIAKVEFYVNDQLITTDASFPYNASYAPTSAGVYSVKVIAYDNLGNAGSTVNSVQYGLAAPSISLVDQDEDCFIGVNLNAPDNVASDLQYELYERADGQAWSQTPTVIKSGSAGDLIPYITFFNNHAVGKFDYRARVCPVGNSAACSAYSSTISNTIDSTCGTTTLPTVTLVNPPSTIQLGQTVTLSATVGVTNAMANYVRFYYGNTEIGVDYSPPYTLNWTPTTAGRANLYAKVDVGNDGTGVSNFVVVEVIGSSTSSSNSAVSSSSSVVSSAGGVVSSDGNSAPAVSSQPNNTATSSVPAFSFNAEAPDNFKYDLTTSGVPDLGSSEFVAATQGKLDVNNGAAQYSVAIDLPPAIRDLKPKLSLSYNSRSGNGLMGVGWNIGGLSAITRCRTSFAVEGTEAQKSNPRYSIGDRLCLDGQKLMLASDTGAANDANYWTNGAVYKTEIDNFSKIEAHGTSANGGHEYFTVRTKDGRVLTYGREESSQNSRIHKPGESTGAVGTWALDKVEDVYGNNYTITYTNTNANGDYYPARINFAPESAVVFTYQDRTGQVPWGYDMGGYYKHPKVLDKVTTYINVTTASNPEGGAAVKQYDVNYKLSADTQRELVDTITECGYEAGSLKCARPLTFSWQAGELGFDEVNPHTISYCAGGTVSDVVQFIDIDADGYNDALKKGGEIAWGTSANCFDDGSWVASGYDMTQPLITPKGYALLVKSSNKTVTPNTQSLGLIYNINKAAQTKSYLEIDSVAADRAPVSTRDFNNDSLDDFTFRAKKYRQENTATPTFTTSGEFLELSSYYAGSYLIDQDGDGIKESIDTFNNESVLYGDLGIFLIKDGLDSGWKFEANQTTPYMGPRDFFAPDIKLPGGIYRTIADVNGDGNKDFLYHHINKNSASPNYGFGEWLYRINLQNGQTGTEVNTGIVAAKPNQGYTVTNHYSYTYDYDKDGREDLIAINPVAPTGYEYCKGRVLLARDTNGQMRFEEAKDAGGNTLLLNKLGNPCAPLSYEPQNNLFIGDINNDGIMDLNSFGTVYYGKTKQPDLLSVVTDGFSAETKLEYSTLVDDANNGKPLYTPDSTKPTFPQVPGSRAMQVVKRVSTSNGKTGYNNRFYNYTGAKTDIQGRGFLGFANIIVTDVAAGVIASTDYYQSFPYVGKPDTKTIKNTAGDLISSTKYTYGVHSNNSRFVYLDYSVQKNYQLLTKDLNSPLSATKVDNTFDACGNLTAQNTKTGTGVNASAITGLLSQQDVVNTVDNYDAADCSDDFISNRTQTFSKTSVTDDARTVVTDFTPTNTSNNLAKEVLTTTAFSGTAQQKVTTLSRTAKGVLSGSSDVAKDIDNGTMATRELTSSDFENDLFPKTLTNTVSAGNHVTKVDYDYRFGIEKHVELPNQQVTNRVYDALGRLIKETSSDGSERKLIAFACPSAKVTCPAGAKYGVATQVTNDLVPGKLGEPLSIVYYDSLQREVRRSVYSLGGKSINVDTGYYTNGRLEKTSEPYVITNGSGSASYWSYYTNYDALGRAHAVANADGGSRATSFEKDGFQIKVTDVVTVISPVSTKTQTTQRFINALDQVEKVVDAKSTPVDYTYNSLGGLNTTKVNSNAATLVTIDYDNQGNKSRIADPDAGVIDFEYNGFGEMRRQTWQKGSTNDKKSMTLEYDQLGRQVQRIDTPAANKGSPTTYTWVWDSTTDKRKMGQLVSESGNGQTVTYGYDAKSRVESQTTTISGLTGSRVITYGYDDFSRPISVIYPNDFTVIREYHAAGMAVRTQDATDLANPHVLWAMGNDLDDRGNFNQQLWGNGVVTKTTFGAKDGQLTGIKSGRLSATNKVDNLFGDIQALSYEYDTLGDVYSRSSQRTNGLGVVQESEREDYTYDDLNRLKTSTASGLFGRTNNYDYNELGNLTSRTSYMGTSTTNDDVGVLAYVPSSTNNAGVHAVTSAGGNSYKYDKYGNMVERGVGGTGAVETIDYDVFNKPTRIVGVNTTTIDYDANHERFREVANGVASYSFAGGLYEEIVEGTKITKKSYVDGVIVNTQVVNNNVVASNDTLFVHTDGQGSSDAISDRLGAFVTRMSFSDWGERQKADGKTGTPTEKFPTDNGYTGHHQLDQHKLVHMGGRVYDPELGRFLSADLLVQSPYSSQSFNRYSYVFNSPLSRIDPSGYLTSCTASGGGHSWGQDYPGGPKYDQQEWPHDTLECTGGFDDFSDPSGFGEITNIDWNAPVNLSDTIQPIEGNAFIGSAEAMVQDISGGFFFGDTSSILALHPDIQTQANIEAARNGKAGPVIKAFALVAMAWNPGRGAAKLSATDFKHYDQARNAALNWLKEKGFKAEVQTIGKFGENEGKAIGMKTADGAIGFRVEYDARSGAHINVWAGKEKGPHFTFEGDSELVNMIIKRFED